MEAKSNNIFMRLAWLALALMVAGLITVPLPLQIQMLAAGGFLLLLVLLRPLPHVPMARVLFLACASFVVARYLYWRTTETLTFHDPVSYFFAMTLYLAEVYGIAIFFMGVFVNIHPYRREVASLPDDKSLWPSVDVLVPSYDEGLPVLETTLMAAVQIDYPADKLNVYLCDDGGTEQRCNWPYPAEDESDYDAKLAKAVQMREKARRRRKELQELCREIGCHYVTRARNEHAKAGNLNNALLHFTQGDLVLILDADHVPTADILRNTVGWMVKDPNMFLLQTPHFFLNADPLEKNLRTFGYMPSENEMFYRQIQLGLDFWDASFFCGSAAILRRKHLLEVGGICGETITEDAETALNLHARGYSSGYIQRPMISGLSPEELMDFMGQRQRWAQGMASIFRLSNPLLIPGLKFPQRVCYLNSCAFWFFPLARLTFLLAPLPFLMFGLKIYDTNALSFFAYGVPHVLAVLIASDFLYGKVRWAFISEIYELLQSFYTLPAVLTGLFKPKGAQFKVTAKGKSLDEDYLAPITNWFYLIGGSVLVSIVYGITRLVDEVQFLWTEKLAGQPPREMLTHLLTTEGTFYATAITLAWAIFNFLLMLCSLGAVVERKQRRTVHRLPVNEGAVVRMNETELPARILDISTGGLLISLHEAAKRYVQVGDTIEVHPEDYPGQQGMNFHAKVVRFAPSEKSELCLGVEFEPQNLSERFQKVAYIHGRSQRYVDFQENRSGRRPGIVAGLVHLARLGLKHAPRFFVFFLRSIATEIGTRGSRIAQLLFGNGKREQTPATGAGKASS